MAVIDLTNENQSGTVNGAIFTNTTSTVATGTGVFTSFLIIQNNETEAGFNTDGSPLPLDDKESEHTNAITLASLPIVTGDGGVQYYEFRLDINQLGKADEPQLISLDALKIYQASSSTLT